jgi:hypothetical protein
MGQDLSHGSAFIGIGDKRNISVSAINVNYRYCRYRLWQISRVALAVLARGIATVNAAVGDDLRRRNDVARGPSGTGHGNTPSLMY